MGPALGRPVLRALDRAAFDAVMTLVPPAFAALRAVGARWVGARPPDRKIGTMPFVASVMLGRSAAVSSIRDPGHSTGRENR